MAIDPPVTKHQTEFAAANHKKGAPPLPMPAVRNELGMPAPLIIPPTTPFTEEQRRLWVEEQMRRRELTATKTKHNHYFKDVTAFDVVDVYRVLQLFNVTDPCIQHAVKKLLVAGGRGAGKDIRKDVSEAIDSLARFLEMRDEETVDLLK